MREFDTDVLVVGAGASGVLAARAMRAEGLAVSVVDSRSQSNCASPWWVEVDAASILQQVVPMPAPGVPVRLPELGADFFSPSGTRCVHLSPSPLYGFDLQAYLAALRKELAENGVAFLFEHMLASWKQESAGGVECLLEGESERIRVKARLLVLAPGGLEPFRPQLQAAGWALPNRPTLVVQARHESWELDPAAALSATWPSPPGTSVNVLAASSAFSTLGFWVRPDGRFATLLSGISPQPMSPPPRQALQEFRASYPGVFVQQREASEMDLPITRPIPQLAHGSVALIGTAACQVSPLTGSALSLTGQAARLLAQSAVSHCRNPKGDALWWYSHQYMTTFGALQGFAEGMTRTLRRHGRDPQFVETIFQSGLLNASEMHRVLTFRPLEMGARELPIRLAALVKRPAMAAMGPGVAAALSAWMLMRTTYPTVDSKPRLEAFEARLQSVLAGR